MKTIMSKEEQEVKLIYPFPYSMTDDGLIDFRIQGLNPERSIEDRDVYVSIKTHDKTKSAIQHVGINTAFWLQAENAIELGLALIDAGNYAFKANMIQHQLNWSKSILNKFLWRAIIDHIEVTELDHNPKNYGDGFHTINIKPIWLSGQAPKYQEDFNFDMVLYYQNNEDFTKNIKSTIQDTQYVIIHTNI